MPSGVADAPPSVAVENDAPASVSPVDAVLEEPDAPSDAPLDEPRTPDDAPAVVPDAPPVDEAAMPDVSDSDSAVAESVAVEVADEQTRVVEDSPAGLEASAPPRENDAPRFDVLEHESVAESPTPAGDTEAPATESATELFVDELLVVEAEAEAEAELEAEAEAEVAAETETEAAVELEVEETIAALAAEGAEASAVAGAAPAIALRGVVKEFGRTRAVDAIDLTIPAGSFFGLVGPNGAGKTTTLSMIAGLLRPDSGTIEVCGVDAASDPSRAKRMIGVLPDRLRTFDRLTGRQLLYYYGVLRGLSASVVQSRIADLARAFDLVDALGRVVSDYSAGMTKKIMLAGAMIHSPRVLVLDEPFESLDPASSQVILDILQTYVEHGGTVVLSSHGMALVERVCTSVAVLVEGEVLAAGTVDEVRGDQTLEQRFVELSGGLDDVEGLAWLHTFSD